MPRNAEVIRQWTILRELEASRGVTIRRLAETTGVTTRTIRRDLAALQEAGFPLYDVADDATKRWKLDTRPFRRLDDTAFTLAELSALYFSRTLVECFAVPPFGRGPAERVHQAGSGARPPHAAVSRSPPGRDPGQGTRPPAGSTTGSSAHTIGRLLDSLLHQRRLDMRLRLALQPAREVVPHRSRTAWCTPRAGCTCSPSCRGTGRCARSRSSGSAG